LQPDAYLTPSHLGLEHTVHGEPAHEGIEPAGAGRFLGVVSNGDISTKNNGLKSPPKIA
jgi:hypothetical protein